MDQQTCGGLASTVITAPTGLTRVDKFRFVSLAITLIILAIPSIVAALTAAPLCPACGQ
jgi:hypothetical protein